jgi:two-component system nitrate/nitrite response regulator NarL
MMNSVGAKPIQVFVAAPAMLCWGLERLIQTAHPHFELAGTATSLSDAHAAMATGRAEILVLDLDAGYDAESITELQRCSQSRVIVLTSSQDFALLDRVVVAGARGVVRHSDPPSALLKAIEKVHEGELWIDRGAAGRIFIEMARQNLANANDPDRLKISALTTRERQTIAAVAGDTAAPGKVIAGRLFISEHTLRNHLSSIYEKLDLANRVDLYAFATKHHLHRV